ncbi:MAG: inorganic phosphate transporter [Gammaproteobacteria bacterium]|nr:inorganic phosphate transporter [Gammaproteobacteria bacterium]NIM73777.1 inorganic phosphate transporter [Gammaproteobacteria bacterium]NIN39354.1 inorganic phosphate transporter [Gammaproteobacteria bacterium]NIO25019.1 inorganic phosphate transporter [Gammaproteobacteria bacterium]NIO65651.1 inorganic phosphate transporter [Gammaproteobacteria bacterium]
MDLTVLFFLTSGLLLGWSLGANDAANIFGTAVGTRMVRFATAALVCSVFVVLGAVVSGAGAAHTLGALGSINALAGSFMAALSAAGTVYVMTKWGLPVSTSQAIVGAIIGWNLFSGSVTDSQTLLKIVATWVACPVLAALIAVPLLKVTAFALRLAKLHLLKLDAYTRLALILAGAFGAYSLGANNIANVMGVFVDVSPFKGFSVAGFFRLSSVQQLFLIGAIAIAVGVFTYSKRVMVTVGAGILPMSPVAAWVVVIAHSIVLFLFASQGLEHMLASAGLPTIPLVPVSSSQAVVGAVVGLGLMRGGGDVDWKLVGNIAGGWVTTPLISGVVCFIALFFLQNVFGQKVYREVHYSLSAPVLTELAAQGAEVTALASIKEREFRSAQEFKKAVEQTGYSGPPGEQALRDLAQLSHMYIDPEKFSSLDRKWLSSGQISAVERLEGREFAHPWQLARALAANSSEWSRKDNSTVNKYYNARLERKLEYVYRKFAGYSDRR